MFTFGENASCASGMTHCIDPSTGVLIDTAVSRNTRAPVQWTVASSALLAAASASLDPTVLAPTSTTHLAQATTQGLSTGSCVGIAVAVAVAVVAVGVLAWLFLRERRNRTKMQKKQDPPICPTPKMTQGWRGPVVEVEDRFRSEAP